MRVRSERVDVAQPRMLARVVSSFATMFRAPALDTTGVARYGTDPTLFPIVSFLARSTGGVGYHLYAPGTTGQDEDREEITLGQHPAVDLFTKPNPFQARAEFVRAGQQHVDLVGECTILVESIGKMPVRMWIIPPWKLTPVESGIVNTPAAKQFLLGWIYTNDEGEQIPLTKDQIIQIKQPNPGDPYRGIGPVQAALTMLDSSRYSAEWNKNFFINGASPDGVIQIEEAFSDDEFREFTERWRETHQGVNNAHRVAVLENGAVWVPNNVTQRDMQFHELQMLSSDFIRKAFAFPKTMLGDTDNANRAVAEAGEYTYGKWHIEPRAADWCSALNNQLMPLFGKVDPAKTPVWDFDPVVERDEQTEAVTISTRADAVQKLIQAGFNADEALAVAGLPPMVWKKPEVPGFDENGKPFPKEPSGDAPGSPSAPSADGGAGEDGSPAGKPPAGKD